MKDKHIDPIDKIRILKGTIAQTILNLRSTLAPLPTKPSSNLERNRLYNIRQEIEQDSLIPLEEILNFPSAYDLEQIIRYKHQTINKYK